MFMQNDGWIRENNSRLVFSLPVSLCLICICIMLYVSLTQSCPRVTFLGPDPTRQNVDPTRPAIADQKSDPTRPAARSFPHMYSIYLNNNLLIS